MPGDDDKVKPKLNHEENIVSITLSNRFGELKKKSGDFQREGAQAIALLVAAKIRLSPFSQFSD